MKTVTIRIYEQTRDHLKIRAAKEKKSIIRLIEELSKKK